MNKETRNKTIKQTKYQDKLSKAFEDINLKETQLPKDRTELTDTSKLEVLPVKINKIPSKYKGPRKKVLTKEEHANNNRGHVTTSDIEAMKRWFSENWKTTQTIPFEILTLQSFLITYFGYTYGAIEKLPPRKFKVLEANYADFLKKVGGTIQTRLFNYENLKPFMDMCRRNFQKQKAYTKLIQSYIEESKITRMGYLISANLATQLLESGNTNVMVATSKTRFHTILTWLSKAKLVYIPDEFRAKLNIEADLDYFEKVSDVTDYLVGFGAYKFTDVKTAELGINGPPELSWFIALNNYVQTAPILTISPQIKNFENEPHLATLTYFTSESEYSIDVVLLVDWEFYNKHKNKTGVINISISANTVLINSEIIPMQEQDIVKLTTDLTVAMHRMTGTKILADFLTVNISVKKSLEKMGSFMSKLAAAKNLYLSKRNSIYKLTMIAGKASGKTTLINLIKGQLSEKLYVEDSDDYGKFLTVLTSTHASGDIDYLDTELTEEQVIDAAKAFAELSTNSGLDNIPSYFNSVVSVLIRNDMSHIEWNKLRPIDHALLFSETLNRLYAKYYCQIRDLYYRWSSGQNINERVFESGIYRHMIETGKNTYVAFFHIFSSNYKRKPSDLNLRYEPNFSTNISLYKRMIKKESTIIDAMTESLLKMFYDQAAEYITTVTGPAAFMGLFGLVPILSYSDSLYFDFKTHLDTAE